MQENKKPLAGLWRENPETPEGKYLVKRRDVVHAVLFGRLCCWSAAARISVRAISDGARRRRPGPWKAS